LARLYCRGVYYSVFPPPPQGKKTLSREEVKRGKTGWKEGKEKITMRR